MKKIRIAFIIGLIIAAFFIYDNARWRDAAFFIIPLEIDKVRIRSDAYGDGEFGAKRKDGRSHAGVDILAPLDTPVLAAKGGWAVARFDEDGYGNYVKIYHGLRLMTLYGHLKDTNIDVIKRVRQGDVIGRVGKTGNARYRGIRPHIHFEVRKDGRPVDPMKGYIK